jgi:hypothetical protein
MENEDKKMGLAEWVGGWMLVLITAYCCQKFETDCNVKAIKIAHIKFMNKMHFLVPWIDIYLSEYNWIEEHLKS